MSFTVSIPVMVNGKKVVVSKTVDGDEKEKLAAIKEVGARARELMAQTAAKPKAVRQSFRKKKAKKA